MIDPDGIPPADAPREHHADWLELSVLTNERRAVSVREFVRELCLTGSTDAVLGDEAGGETDEEGLREAIAEAAFAEIDERFRSSGGEQAYPFEIGENSVRLRKGMDGSVYSFLLLLSVYGKDAGPPGMDGARLFEDVCAEASAAYLGGRHPHVKSRVFGFPRRLLPKAFPAALDALCRELGEGRGHREERAELPDQKDAKLDIVAWRDFEDRRPGKVIVFGQCATGGNWREKLLELPPPQDWCSYWMQDRPAVWPTRWFFVPHRIEMAHWFYACVHGGVLHDRCRIAQLAGQLDTGLASLCAAWSRWILKKARKR
jgi:hypothetical protein